MTEIQYEKGMLTGPRFKVVNRYGEALLPMACFGAILAGAAGFLMVGLIGNPESFVGVWCISAIGLLIPISCLTSIMLHYVRAFRLGRGGVMRIRHFYDRSALIWDSVTGIVATVLFSLILTVLG